MLRPHRTRCGYAAQALALACGGALWDTRDGIIASYKSEEVTHGAALVFGGDDAMSMGSRTRVVLSNAGNVIVHATHAITFAILEDFGIASKNARRFFANPDYAAFARGTITGDEFYRQIVDFHVRCRLDKRQVRMAHDAHIYDADPGVIAALAHVTVPLMIATDTNAWQTDRVQQLVDLERLARRTFRSDQLGALKQDAGTFERIAAEIGEEPSRILLIDDSANKIARAKRAGFDAVQFRDVRQLVAELQVRHVFAP